ncbi:MAG: hypothetical protein JWN04_443 [Myxococcaceae bacterium]|nr:hypothetical protein [Myxococcaceae bacterium]
MAARSLRSRALAMSAVGTLVFTQGCVDDGVSLHVICPIVPTISADACIYDPSSGACLGTGIMNLGSASHYELNLRVESGLKPRARDVPPQGEPNGLQVRSATVELRTTLGEKLAFGTDANGMPIDNPFEVAVAGYIPPAGSAAINVTIVTPAHAEQLYDAKNVPIRPQIVAGVKIKGKTNGQVDVESGEYVWPVLLTFKSSKKVENSACITKPYCAGSVGTDAFADVCTE